MRYQTRGTCSSAIDIEVNNGIIESVLTPPDTTYYANLCIHMIKKY